MTKGDRGRGWRDEAEAVWRSRCATLGQLPRPVLWGDSESASGWGQGCGTSPPVLTALRTDTTRRGSTTPPPADPTFNFMFTTDLVASARFLDTCRDSVIHTTTGQDRTHAGREYAIYMIWKIHFHEKPAKGPDLSRASSSWLAHVRLVFQGVG